VQGLRFVEKAREIGEVAATVATADKGLPTIRANKTRVTRPRGIWVVVDLVGCFLATVRQAIVYLTSREGPDVLILHTVIDCLTRCCACPGRGRRDACPFACHSSLEDVP
jgi:hypothetical protein